MDLRSIGQRIRQRRRAQGLTLEELARDLDISHGRLHQIEQGTAPRVDRLVSIARVLGYSASELLGDEWAPSERPPSVEQMGKRIRVRRVELDMSQAELGEAIGMQPPQVGRIERGERSMKVVQLEALAKVLRCPMGYLLGEVPHPEGGWVAEL